MTSIFQLAWGVLLLPVAAFLVMALLGRAIEKMASRRFLGALAVLPIACSFGLSLFLTKGLDELDAANRTIVLAGPPWIEVLGLRIPFELSVDPLSLLMCLIITGVGSLIFLYSTGYMAEDRDYPRFFTYMNLFAASMLLLVLANNLPLLFIGWEGVGLCSYLLIGFWYRDLDNVRAANKAFIVNRVGDWGLTLGIFMVLIIISMSTKQPVGNRWLSFDSFSNPAFHITLIQHPTWTTVAALLLFVGAAGKSAQFPLYLWLPDAMAGPTPVSALIHAATMVTSGVVLLNRMHLFFEMSPFASAVVCAIGAFTALFAALVALGQTDIKRVLAYSTVSQLGFMFIGCGAGSYWSGMFHVTTHAFFKALLFLGAGAVIHAMAHNQDLRNYGNLRKYLPITCATMVVGWLSISAIGLPAFGNLPAIGLAGFHSKEAIIGAALANDLADVNGLSMSVVSGWIGLFVAMLTALYMTRMTWLTFFGKQERWRSLVPDTHAHVSDPEVEAKAPESDPYGFYLAVAPDEPTEAAHPLVRDHTPKEVSASMWLPLVILALLSVVGGWVLAQNQLLEKWLAPISAPSVVETVPEPAQLPLATISVCAALFGIVVGYLWYRGGLPESEGFDDRKWSSLRLLARRQFGYDAAMTEAAVDGGDLLAFGLWRGIDLGVIDGIVNGLAAVAGGVGAGFSRLQRGLVRSYALLMLIGGVCILIFMLLGGGR